MTSIPTMRLLFCNACKSLEEVEDYEGPLEVDPLIEQLVRKHNERAPMEHGGRDLRASPMRIAVVPDIKWATDREEIIKQINNENRKVGFDAWVYEATNTYSEDALRCYSDHHRPKQGCIDWWDESKRIGRPTEEGQAAVKDQYKLGQRDPHLCQYCPVASFVQTEINHRKGLYRG